MSLFTEPATIRAAGPGTSDRYNAKVPGPVTETEHLCWYDAAVSAEDIVAADQQIDAYLVHFPPRTQISAGDIVVLEIGDFRVKGPPARQPGGFLVEGYTRVLVERVRG